MQVSIGVHVRSVRELNNCRNKNIILRPHSIYKKNNYRSSKGAARVHGECPQSGIQQHES